MNTVDFITNITSKVQKCKNYSEGSLELKNNKDSETIWFCKSAVLKIKELKNQTRIEIAKKHLKNFDMENEAGFTKSEPEWAKAVLNDLAIEKILRNIESVFTQCYLDEPVESFGCCSRYNDCSDEKKCIHPDQKLSKGCIYKSNLDNGRIFYGKNQSTD
jgi:hypothetical protein